MIGALHTRDNFFLPEGKGPNSMPMDNSLDELQRTKLLWQFGIKEMRKGMDMLMRDGLTWAELKSGIEKKIEAMTDSRTAGAQGVLNRGLALILAFMKPTVVKREIIPELEKLLTTDKKLYEDIIELVARADSSKK